jgi:rRNA large subunit m3Psi methyltransferase RlmH
MNAIVALGKSSKNIYINKINYYLSKVGKIFETELINFDFNNQKKNHNFIKFNRKFINDKNIFTVTLDDQGAQYTSKILLNNFLDWKRNYKKIVFIIGDAYGFPKELNEFEPNLIMSISKFTLTHEIIPLILAEQIYRISCMHNNHPYHK